VPTFFYLFVLFSSMQSGIAIQWQILQSIMHVKLSHNLKLNSYCDTLHMICVEKKSTLTRPIRYDSISISNRYYRYLRYIEASLIHVSKWLQLVPPCHSAHHYGYVTKAICSNQDENKPRYCPFFIYIGLPLILRTIRVAVVVVGWLLR